MRGGGEEEEYNDDQNGNYGDEPYDDNTPQKRKRGRPKGSTKTTNKKPKAELAEGESKLKMGRAWYAVNDVKREFRYFTGLQEGEVPCSKKEEKEVKRRLNGYTRLLSNGRSKIAIFEDVDKDQQEQDMQQEQNNFENVYPGGNGDYGQQQEYHYQTGTEEYQNQDYQNQQQHLYHQQMYGQQNQGEGEHNYQQYQGEYQVNNNDGNTYNDSNVYHNTGQDHYNQQMYQQTGHHDYSNMQQYGHDVYQQQQQQNLQQQQDPSNYHVKPEKNEDDDDDYQPGNEEEEN